MEEAAQAADFSDEQKVHRRGEYPVLNVGVSPGQGSCAPLNLNLHGNQHVVDELLNDPDVKRMAAYQNCMSHFLSLGFDEFLALGIFCVQFCSTFGAQSSMSTTRTGLTGFFPMTLSSGAISRAAFTPPPLSISGRKHGQPATAM